MSHEWDCRCPRCEADEAKYTREDEEPERYERGGEVERDGD